MKKRPHKSGAILLEALLAIVILASALTVIIRSLISTLWAVSHGVQAAKAAFLAEDKMFEIMTRRGDWAGSGQFPRPFDQYQYEVKETASAETASENQGIKNIALDVSWQHAGRERELSFTVALPEVQPKGEGE